MSRDEEFAEALHALSAPLTILRNRLALALEAADAEARKRLLGECAQEVEGLSRLVSDLLLLVRLDADALPLTDEPIDLAIVAREAFESFRPAAEARGLVVRFSGEDPLPLRGDAQALRRLFLALLDNAVKYTPSGGLVSMEAGLDGVTVSDTGVGIPADSLPRVFDRFYQGDREHGGAGLGLGIAQAIAKRHGGAISIESSPGQGTRVRFKVGRATSR